MSITYRDYEIVPKFPPGVRQGGLWAGYSVLNIEC
jgi:hypothetical protein